MWPFLLGLAFGMLFPLAWRSKDDTYGQMVRQSFKVHHIIFICGRSSRPNAQTGSLYVLCFVRRWGAVCSKLQLTLIDRCQCVVWNVNCWMFDAVNAIFGLATLNADQISTRAMTHRLPWCQVKCRSNFNSKSTWSCAVNFSPMTI